MRKLLFIICAMYAFACSNTIAQTTDPMVVFGNLGKPKGTANYTTTCAAILADPLVHIEGPAGWEVTSYAVSIATANGSYLGPYIVHRQELTPEIKKIIETQRGKSGEVLIEEIKATGSDRRTRIFNGLKIKYTS